jgi:hypothetical protein
MSRSADRPEQDKAPEARTMHIKTWHVDVFLSEEDDLTEARAVLTADRPNAVSGVGSARRNPHDPAVPEIGDELAVSRALADLSERLMRVAAGDIDDSVGERFRAG